MNVYLIVEGKTEKKVYPRWLSHLAPSFTQIYSPDEAQKNSYYLIGGGGFPYIFELIRGALEDISEYPDFDMLIVALDCDGATPTEKVREIEGFIHEAHGDLGDLELQVVPQRACVESWFLANRKIVTAAPTDPELIGLLRHYDVSQKDPEKMEAPNDWAGSVSAFHFQYLKTLLLSKRVRYSKTRPNHVVDAAYIERVIERVNDRPAHCRTVRRFINLTRRLEAAS